MAALTLTLGDKNTPASLIGEIRQRLHFNVSSSGTDPSTISDALITQRINMIQNRWAAIFRKGGKQDYNVAETTITLTGTESEKALDATVIEVWQVLRISESTSGGDVAVVMVPPRELYRYTQPALSRTGAGTQMGKFYAALMSDPVTGTPLIRFASLASSVLAGSYKIQHYVDPDVLALTSDTLFFEPQYYDTFIWDVVASILTDGGDIYKAMKIKEMVQATLQEISQHDKDLDDVSYGQIADAMGYGGGQSFNYWLS